ncbi:uncharacterized protein LOC117651847 [Thrips palmi]|uniref:Uncharacterized protein LOC117651847 n=1 Tax=Thrips palmi TaxID=161013 RepID=A0A6P9A6U9_THRPL|nr:uncharacterized protein LOC117651847 [Thrips palmi]
MASDGEPAMKKRRSNDEGWWNCASCLSSSVCWSHAADVLSSAAGRPKIQSRLEEAQAAVAKAQKKADGLQRALKRMARGLTSPVLLILHGGWLEGDKGWAPGRLPVSLAVPSSALDPALAASTCAALSKVKLEMEGCSSGMFYGRDVPLPDQLVALVPARPAQEMRPGAVLFDTARQRLFIHVRRTPEMKRTRSGSCKLLGYLLPEGLNSLSFTHVPNARTAACVYCHRTDSVSIPFTDVKVQTCFDPDKGVSSGCGTMKSSPNETNKATKKDPAH